MPFNKSKNYSQVLNNEYDVRIPLHSDESFQHGIAFQAKYIGSLDVPRPNNRMEIVAAMRRIRYDFKAKGMKKKKVTLEISVDGVKVSLVRRKTKKTKDWPIDDSTLLLMHHPVYRIFYVSHDSQDLKIFSYIARDASTSFFRCNVFKTTKKSQAMRIVRTVGQAFEVCHKYSTVALSSSPGMGAHQDVDEDDVGEEEEHVVDEEEEEEEEEENESRDTNNHCRMDHVFTMLDTNNKGGQRSVDYGTDIDHIQATADLLNLSLEQAPTTKNATLDSTSYSTMDRTSRLDPSAIQQLQQQIQLMHHQQQQAVQRQESQNVSGQQQQQPHASSSASTTSANNNNSSSSTPLALQHEVLLLRQQVEQQQQQTQAAIAQVKLLKDQLAAETAARMEAQARTHQLLIHNKELLDHIQTLVIQMQELECKVPAISSLPAASAIPQLPLTARIMEWLQLQPISRQESGFVEDAAATNTQDDCDEVDVMVDEVRRRFYDAARRSLPTSVRSRSRFGRRWKFLSRKSSWRSL